MPTKLLLLWIGCGDGLDPTEFKREVSRDWELIESNGASALQALSSRPPTAIVFDFDETLKPGLRLLLTVKRQYPSIPVLMITAEHNENLAVWAFRARVWNYFVKPVSIREFNHNLSQLGKVLRQRGSEARSVERPSSIFPTQSHDRTDPMATIQLIAETLRRDYASGLRASQLARTVRLSRYQFSRLFKRSFGCSFRNYLIRMRIMSACRLLSKGGAATSVTDVSIAVGFEDASHFARMFRQVMGESPSAYARRTAVIPTMHLLPDRTGLRGNAGYGSDQTEASANDRLGLEFRMDG